MLNFRTRPLFYNYLQLRPNRYKLIGTVSKYDHITKTPLPELRQGYGPDKRERDPARHKI